ncbi:hypothetical protein [Limibacillus halophilus]|uniref:Uncharacterized protein n=1 Tax=Limibacillus halophilus TaxID=1579333 RepID=A0A839SU79_9PROT|nr:hypothetical protein [Limibacillus halophilus]MBB3064535.1 hypothetical protein [Limibacillus halophilus]
MAASLVDLSGAFHTANRVFKAGPRDAGARAMATDGRVQAVRRAGFYFETPFSS